MIENMRDFNMQHPRDRRVPRRNQPDRAGRRGPINLMAAQQLDDALNEINLPPERERPRRETREVINYDKFSKTGKKQ